MSPEQNLWILRGDKFEPLVRRMALSFGKLRQVRLLPHRFKGLQRIAIAFAAIAARIFGIAGRAAVLNPINNHFRGTQKRMLSHAIPSWSKTVSLFLLVSWTCPSFLGRDVLLGQVRRPIPTMFIGKSVSVHLDGQAVPVATSRMGTAPGGFTRRTFIDEGGPVRRPVPAILSGSLTDVGGANVSASDNLDLSLLEIEIQKAEEQVSASSFLRRILPQIHLSASFGVHDLVFVDPATFVPYIIPKDAYRLTVSLSLNELLNSSRHTQASFELQKLKTEYVQRTLRQSQSRKTLEHQLLALQQELDKLDEEKTMIEQLLRFNELRFRQGKIEFDGLMRTKLELKSAEKAIQRLQSQKEQIRLKLSQGEFQ